jgi:hypothetical protein
MNYQNPHAPSCPWYSVTESMGAPNLKWCEETLCSWISEPANTWSNVMYLIVAFFLTWYSFKNNHHRILKYFPAVIFIMGSFSFYYHQSNFYGSQVLDFVGMFFLVGWTSGFNLIRLKKLKAKNFLLYNFILISSLTAVVHVMYLLNIKFQILMVLGTLLIITTEFLSKKLIEIRYHWFGGALFLLGIALFFSIMDHNRIWCHPEEHGLFSQGHALWHWISGLSMFAIYKHFAQEALRPQEDPGNN